MNGALYAWLVGSSPPVVVQGATPGLLAGQIIRAGTELDERTYWANRLRDR